MGNEEPYDNSFERAIPRVTPPNAIQKVSAQECLLMTNLKLAISVMNSVNDMKFHYDSLITPQRRPNNTYQNRWSTIEPLQLSLEAYAKKLLIVPNSLNREAILGKIWTKKHRAKIDCYSNEMTFPKKGKIVRWSSNAPLNQI